jgi:hypothetical protein
MPVGLVSLLVALACVLCAGFLLAGAPGRRAVLVTVAVAAVGLGVWRVAEGAGDHVVPDLVGGSGCDAARELVERDLRYVYNGVRKPQDDFDEPPPDALSACGFGRVVSQRPAAGSRLEDGAVVSFEVRCQAIEGCWVG